MCFTSTLFLSREGVTVGFGFQLCCEPRSSQCCVATSWPMQSCSRGCLGDQSTATETKQAKQYSNGQACGAEDITVCGDDHRTLACSSGHYCLLPLSCMSSWGLQSIRTIESYWGCDSSHVALVGPHQPWWGDVQWYSWFWVTQLPWVTPHLCLYKPPPSHPPAKLTGSPRQA